jgi:hypothetical protein
MVRAGIEIGLNAAIVAVNGPVPVILCLDPDTGARAQPDTAPALPFGPFDPIRHRTLEIGLRSWVDAQTRLTLGYVEQLYTFGDRGRNARPGDEGPHVVSVGYLALSRTSSDAEAALAAMGARWRPWYDFFPWEDWRGGRPSILDRVILPILRDWAREPAVDAGLRPLGRRDRLRLFFGEDGTVWDEEKGLERYELLYEAGLVAEARRDGRPAALQRGSLPPLGLAMRFDHRRILATAISRLRAKLKYRPVVFELLGEAFTLTELQTTVEAISGTHLHKQNFRRLVESGALVEPIGMTITPARGRPAQLFRFRREVTAERPAPGLRVGSRSS